MENQEENKEAGRVRSTVECDMKDCLIIRIFYKLFDGVCWTPYFAVTADCLNADFASHTDLWERTDIRSASLMQESMDLLMRKRDIQTYYDVFT